MKDINCLLLQGQITPFHPSSWKTTRQHQVCGGGLILDGLVAAVWSAAKSERLDDVAKVHHFSIAGGRDMGNFFQMCYIL